MYFAKFAALTKQEDIGLRSTLPNNAASAIRRFWRERHAVVAVEVALLAVPMIGLVFAILETALVMLLSISLENTTQQMARMIKTGQAQQAGIQSASDFRSKLLCPAFGARNLPVYISCSSLLIDARTSQSLSQSDVSNDFYQTSGASSFCLGGPQSIVVLRVAYVFPSFLPIRAIFSSGTVGVNRAGLVNNVPGFVGWYHLIFTAAAFQNENYSGTASCT